MLGDLSLSVLCVVEEEGFQLRRHKNQCSLWNRKKPWPQPARTLLWPLSKWHCGPQFPGQALGSSDLWLPRAVSIWRLFQPTKCSSDVFWVIVLWLCQCRLHDFLFKWFGNKILNTYILGQGKTFGLFFFFYPTMLFCLASLSLSFFIYKMGIWLLVDSVREYPCKSYSAKLMWWPSECHHTLPWLH